MRRGYARQDLPRQHRSERVPRARVGRARVLRSSDTRIIHLIPHHRISSCLGPSTTDPEEGRTSSVVPGATPQIRRRPSSRLLIPLRAPHRRSGAPVPSAHPPTVSSPACRALQSARVSQAIFGRFGSPGPHQVPSSRAGCPDAIALHFTSSRLDQLGRRARPRRLGGTICALDDTSEVQVRIRHGLRYS